MEFTIKNRDLCDTIWENSSHSLYERVDLILENLKSKFSLNENHLKIIENKLQNSFMPVFKIKRLNVSRTKTAFLIKYKAFVEADFIICFEENVKSSTSNNFSDNKIDEINNFSQIKRKGRPKLSFENGSEKTKHRRVEEVSLSITRKNGSKICNIIDDPSDRIDAEDNLKDDDPNKLVKALAMYMDLKLTKRKYEKLKKHQKQMFNTDPYPTYIEICNEKNACCPDNGEHIRSSDIGAKINFISLLSHTVKRILQQLSSTDLALLQSETLVLIGKCDMDGAHAQQMTRQKFSMQKNTSSLDESSDERVIKVKKMLAMTTSM